MNAKKVLLLTAAVLLLFSCKRKDDYQELLKKVEINPRFEKSPPIAKNVALEALEKPQPNGDNLKFIAEFDKGIVKGRYLAMLLDDKKVVLRDDGKGADVTAGDNKFSLFVKEDLTQLQQELATRQKNALAESEIKVFRNRQLFTIKPERLRKLDITRFIPGRIFDIPIEIFKIPVGLTDPKKTLMVTDLGVVEDPARTFNPCTNVGTANGVWTFGELMRQMASATPGAIATDAQTSTFILDWLSNWNSLRTVNGEDIPPRTNIQSLIITPWLNASAAAGAPAGQLKPALAPFKLLAIVNRMDLRGNSGYGFSNAGEGRFVFGALGSNCSPQQFTVIFEYGINKKSCSAVKSFATAWHSLDGMTLGTPAYNQALQDITMQFTQCGTNTAKPNQNSINQVRTDEIALNSPWELREFNLLPAGQLAPATVKQEPAKIYNAKVNNPDVQRLAAYVNTNTTIIENNNYEIPLEAPLTSGAPTPTTPFLGGKAHTVTPSLFWNGTAAAGPAFINSDNARQMLSLNACSGCHGGETQTFFTHIKPTGFGSQASLSGFLTGITVIDPAGRPTGAPTSRTFNDLERRKIDLTDFINNRCSRFKVFDLAHALTFTPVRMTH